jgi:two-component system, chemotaxis family, chemotaxis protein CheY
LPKILVIEDYDQIRDLISCMLEMEGHRVVVAEDGIEGVARYRAELPDLVITDMIMPKQGGAETIIQIWQATPDARIIAISGGGSLDGTHPLIVAKRLGVVETLHKPFSANELIACITRSLSRLPYCAREVILAGSNPQ